jgi:hypothetical protein
VSRQAASGLTVIEFCTQERCSKSAFYRWKRDLDAGGFQEQRPALAVRPTAFVRVTVRLVDPNTDQPAPVEAELPNGVRLRIPTSDARLACRLVRVVAAAKTERGGLR